MKTFNRNFGKITLTIALGLGLAVATSLPLHSAAADSVKGGQKMLELNQTAVTATPKAVTTDSMTMACPTCKDEMMTRTTAMGRGAFMKTTTFAQHACSSCRTSIQTSGHGKAKSDHVVHTCANGSGTSGCMMK